MVPKQQRVLCRAAFVLFCILPTSVHLWSLFTSPNPWNTKNNSGQSKSELDNSQKKSKPDSNGSDRSRFPWTRQQGIDSANCPVSEEVFIQKSELPDSHWLRRISSSTFSVSESPDAVVVSISELTVSQSAFQQLQSDLLSRQFKSVMPEKGKLILKIARLTLKRFDKSDSNQVQFRDLKMGLSNSNESVFVSGRRVFKNDSDTQLSPEYPFQMESSWTKNKTTIRLSGLGFPIWILGSGYSEIVGSSAELNGELKSVQFSSRSPSVQFSGQITDVNCENVSAWLNPQLVPLATGRCQISCEKFLTDEKQVREFVGEIRSVSSGTMNSGIVKLLGDRVVWTSTAAERSPYGSFLFFDVTFADGQLQLKSKYEGRQLAWTENGAGILFVK